MSKGDGFAVCTMKKQTGNAGGLSAHIDREVYDPTLDKMITFRPASVRDDSRTILNRECIESALKIGRTQAIWNRLREAGFSRNGDDNQDEGKKTRKIKDDAVIALCFVCTSDEETMKKLEAEGTLNDWIHGNVEWFQKEFGDENVVSAMLHMDETTPHLHITVVPITTKEVKERKEKPKFDENGKPLKNYETDKDGNIILDEKGRAVVKKRKYKKQEVTARLSAKDICNPADMERWQTDYAEAMKPFGMKRGVRGSKQKNVAPAEWNLQQINGKFVAMEKEVEEMEEVMAKNETIIKEQTSAISGNSAKLENLYAELTKRAQASLFDKLRHSGLSSDVRKAFEEKDLATREEILKATMATDTNGKPITWKGGKNDGKQLTWEEYVNYLREQMEKDKVRGQEEKNVAQKETAKMKENISKLNGIINVLMKVPMVAQLIEIVRKVIRTIGHAFEGEDRQFCRTMIGGDSHQESINNARSLWQAIDPYLVTPHPLAKDDTKKHFIDIANDGWKLKRDIHRNLDFRI